MMKKMERREEEERTSVRRGLSRGGEDDVVQRESGKDVQARWLMYSRQRVDVKRYDLWQQQQQCHDVQ